MIQIVELHFRSQPNLNLAAIKARAQDLASDLCGSDFSDADPAFLIVHKQHVVEYDNGKMPAQTAILPTDRQKGLDAYDNAIRQSRRCPEARELLRHCHVTILVSELMARGLAPNLRLSLFHGVLRATIEIGEPDALVFLHSQNVVAPSAYIDACSQAPIRRPGSLNAHFYNVSNSEGDMVMQIRGLAEIGLPDLQCHFRDLDPKEVARVLYNTAFYLVENDAMIEPGDTVSGFPPEAMWRCQFENSILEPKRTVLDVNPGKPYAAGNR